MSEEVLIQRLGSMSAEEWRRLWPKLSTSCKADLEIKLSASNSEGTRSRKSYFEKLKQFQHHEESYKKVIDERKEFEKQNSYVSRTSSVDELAGLRSIPLLLPNDCVVDADGQCHVRENVQRTHLELNHEALEKIRSITGPVAVLSVAGPARTGKSYILGRVVGRQVFSLGHKLDPETMGIWMCNDPFTVPTEIDGRRQNLNVICLDTEGIWAVARGAELDNDSKVLQFSILVGSYFVYNTKNVAMEQDIDFLFLVIQLAKRILLNHGTEDQRKSHAPDFMYLLRDLELEPVIDGERVSVRQYMLDRVLKANPYATSPTELKKMQLRHDLVEFFNTFDAEGLPMPHHDKHVMRRLGEESIEDELKPMFRKLCASIVSRIRERIRPKRSLNGQVLTGVELAAWIEICVEALNSGDQPQLESSWNEVVNRVYDRAIDELMKQFQTNIQSELVSRFPMEGEDLNVGIERESETVLHIFGDKVKSVYQTEVNEVKLEKLTNLMSDYIEAMVNQNEMKSDQLCRELAGQLRDSHLAWLRQGVTPTTNMNTLLESMKQVDKQYKEKSVGPRKQAVWDEFETEVWKDIQKFQSHLEQVQGYNAEIQSNLMQIENERKKGSELATQLAQQKAETEKQNRRLNMEMQRAQSLSNQISQQQASISNLQRSIASEQTKARQYQNQMNSYSSQISSLRTSISSLTSQLQHARNNVRTVHVHHHDDGGGGVCVVM